MKENVTFIQYELLFSDKEIHIEKLKHIAPAVLKRLFAKINDPELYALALLDVDIATKEYVLEVMNTELRIRVEAKLSKMGSDADRNCRSTRSVTRGPCFVYKRLIACLNKRNESFDYLYFYIGS